MPNYEQIKGQGVPIRWVKSVLPADDWNKVYEENPAYCFLTKTKDGVLAAFAIAEDGKEHQNCQDLTWDEIRRVDEHSQKVNNQTRPFQKQETIIERIQKDKVGRVIDEQREMLSIAGIIENRNFNF